jgi:trk system potassium uptake protein TrkH
MDWFDAINHAFTALSTGGFSTRLESIGYWDSATVEAVVLVLMLLGTINFVVAYTFLRGKLRTGLRSGELRLLGVLLVAGCSLLLLFVTANLYPTAEKSLRVALFETASAITTTGFATVDYRTWPSFGWLMLIIFMLIGGGTGSTAGGMKQLRVYIIYKAIIWEVRKAFLPRHTLNEPAIWQGENRKLLTDQQVQQTAVFIGLYLFLFVIGSGSMMIYGYPMQESFFEFASSIGTVGLSVGVTNAEMPVPLLWIQSIGMVLGRLEIFTVVIGSMKLAAESRTLILNRA